MRSDEDAVGLAYSQILQAGDDDKRLRVFDELWGAATAAPGAWAHLWRAVRDLRALLPASDPARVAPQDGHPKSLGDARDAPAQRLAQRVVGGLEDLPKVLAGLHARIARDVEPAPAAVVATLAATRSVADLVTRSLETVFGFGQGPASGGWPVYVAPWNDRVREFACARLLSRAADPDADEVVLRWCASGAAGIVVLERASGLDSMRWTAWESVANTMRRLPPGVAEALAVALAAAGPSREVAVVLGRVARGTVSLKPPLSDTDIAVAELVFGRGPLTGKQIVAQLPAACSTTEQNVRRIFAQKLIPHYGFRNPRNRRGYVPPKERTWPDVASM